MTEINEPKKLMTFSVYSLDVWGHSHDECHDHGCPCVSTNPEDPESYDNPPDCDCHYEVNDRRQRTDSLEILVAPKVTVWKTGVQVVSHEASDEEVLSELIKWNYLTEDRRGMVEIDDSCDFGDDLYVIEKTNGKPILQLEMTSIRDLTPEEEEGFADTIPPTQVSL